MANEFTKSLMPIIKNVIEAIDLRTTSGKKLEIEPPVNAPIKLAKTSAVSYTHLTLPTTEAV